MIEYFCYDKIVSNIIDTTATITLASKGKVALRLMVDKDGTGGLLTANTINQDKRVKYKF